MWFFIFYFFGYRLLEDLCISTNQINLFIWTRSDCNHENKSLINLEKIERDGFMIQL